MTARNRSHRKGADPLFDSEVAEAREVIEEVVASLREAAVADEVLQQALLAVAETCRPVRPGSTDI